MPTSHAHTILILPGLYGLYGSGEGRWQTLWETHLPHARRVRQRDWDEPVRSEWAATLDMAIRQHRRRFLR
jgi:predicted alpha/beta hydrolase family esterase